MRSLSVGVVVGSSTYLGEPHIVVIGDIGAVDRNARLESERRRGRLAVDAERGAGHMQLVLGHEPGDLPVSIGVRLGDGRRVAR